MRKEKNGCGAAYKKNFNKSPARRTLFPPKTGQKLERVQHRRLTVKTSVGDVVLPADYGRDGDTGKFVMPLRQRLGLHGHEPLSPVFEDRLCHLAITATSYQRAAAVAAKWGARVDDSLLQRLVQRVGAREKELSRARIEEALKPEAKEQRARQVRRELKNESFSLVVMIDGCMLRARGPEWGRKPAEAPGERVCWHELKAGVVYRLPVGPAGSARKGARVEVEKFYVATAGGPEELARNLYAETVRRGIGAAERVYVIADGAAWIWRLSGACFPGAVERLDFYHASEHLWALGRVLYPTEESARAWVGPLLKGLKYRGGGSLLWVLRVLCLGGKKYSEEEREALEKTRTYFERHAKHLDYPEAKATGTPLGSGAMESACGQIQGRFKRTGQFWSFAGEEHLLLLELSWRNGDWDELFAA